MVNRVLFVQSVRPSKPQVGLAQIKSIDSGPRVSASFCSFVRFLFNHHLHTYTLAEIGGWATLVNSCAGTFDQSPPARHDRYAHSSGSRLRGIDCVFIVSWLVQVTVASPHTASTS
ncbi:unnamed protein product [Protopolystoma xenopodis]|uniref:Uncharacterized protein n=1 Tax=Protopolystoma xenopodis TaxID=117903 RepID=A0A3S5AZY4_9PLAT|nr:unnamed protein product [Protopolystoma xenopodis]